jgi:aminoglycoside phosphotransferase (APT) family kinase protein
MTAPPPGLAAGSGTPAAEIDVGADLVRALIADQHPDLADRPIRPAASGWDNAVFMVGEDLAARLPRRAAGAPLILNEQRWLPGLADHLPLPIPAPVRLGRPGRDYPYAWSIVPWFAGTPADLDPPAADQGALLADFLRALHRPAPADAPRNPFRGVPLADRAGAVEARMERLGDAVDPKVRPIWRDALAAPIDGPETWLHGDLHGRNVLTRAGRFSAVIDWGDLCRGDPATDVAAVWSLLPSADARREALDAYGVSPPLLRRARGWAVFFGVMLLDAGQVDDLRLAAAGAATLARVVEGP